MLAYWSKLIYLQKEMVCTALMSCELIPFFLQRKILIFSEATTTQICCSVGITKWCWLSCFKMGLLFGMLSGDWIFTDHHNMLLELKITSMILHHALYMTCIPREKSISRKECFLHLLKLTSCRYITVFSLSHFEDRCKIHILHAVPA